MMTRGTRFRELLNEKLQKEEDEIRLIEDSDEWLKRNLAWFRKCMDYFRSGIEEASE